jgi:hypothetical protein
MPKLRLAGLTTVAVVLISSAISMAQQPLQLTNYLNTTQERISARLLATKQPAELVKEVLANDRRVVQENAGPLSDVFRMSKFSNDETVRGIGSTWYSLRLGSRALPLTMPLTSGILQSKAKDMGRLAATSQPDQATIFIDRDQQNERTDTKDLFPDVGERTVRVEKPGYEPAEAKCVIKRDVMSTFKATLMAKGSTASCN